MAGAVGDGEEEAAAASRQSLFSGIADRYDLLNDALSLGQHRVWKTYAVYRAIGGLGGTIEAGVADVRVLDMCCGSGDMALIAATVLGSRGRVTGLDFSADLLEIARGKEAAENAAGNPMVAFVLNNRNPVRWVEGDALDVVRREGGPEGDGGGARLERGHFDVVTMGYGLRNLVSVPRAMDEMFALLRPGGRAAVLDFNNVQPGGGEGGGGLDALGNLAKKVRRRLSRFSSPRARVHRRVRRRGGATVVHGAGRCARRPGGRLGARSRTGAARQPPHRRDAVGVNTTRASGLPGCAGERLEPGGSFS